MRTKRDGTKYSVKFRKYILDTITDPDDPEFENKTKREKVEFMKQRFYAEKKWEIDRYNRQTACVSWLQGLCSVVPIAFENYRILEITKKWGYLSGNPTETEEDQVLEAWWKLNANAILKLIDALNSKKSKLFN